MTALIACPVCAHRGLTDKPYETWPPPEGVSLEPPYWQQLGEPSYEVCARCGFEFGNDDDPGMGVLGDSFESYRDAWTARGRPWLSAEYEQGHLDLPDDPPSDDADCPVCLAEARAEPLGQAGVPDDPTA